jgi:CarboxypepD_reg-like domain
MRERLLLILFLFTSITVLAQQKVSGLVEDDETGDPVSFASIISGKGQGIVTDSSGKFSFVIRKQSKLNDSIIISAAGYSSRKIAVRDLLKNNKVKLIQNAGILEGVKVYASLKGDYLQFGYYREFKFDTSIWFEKIDSIKYKTNERYRWSLKNRRDTRYRRNNKGNGEIGYIFQMPTKKFQIGKVQVKVNHNYDTCWLRLHLRDVGPSGLGLPEDEILKREVILPVTLQYGLVEFDLNWEAIRIPNNQIYVGFELQRCGCSTSDAPSFFFMGNEEGVNFYRENEKEVWKRGVDYTIYVRILTK